jgi:hypothetical protein
MKRCAVTILCGLIVGVLPPGAVAKSTAKEGVRTATICGASGCHVALSPDVTKALEASGAPATPPAQGAPWYSVRARVGGSGEHGKLRLAIVPSRRLIRGCCAPRVGYEWLRMTPNAQRAFQRLTRFIDPFPARTLRGTAPASAARVASVDRPRKRHAIAAGGIGDGGGVPASGLWIALAVALVAIVAGLGWRRRHATGRAT